MTNRRFGRLIVLGYANDKRWRVRCDCGSVKEVQGVSLRRGDIVSCGCYHRERLATNGLRHGAARAGAATPTYRSWQKMIGRCHGKHTRKRYGGRGICVCKRWRGRDGFTHFLADMGPRPDGRTIDRINNDGNYTPPNCRWATRSEQQSNREGNRNFTLDGVTRTLEAWANLLGTQPNVIARRLARGWEVRRALTTPPLHVGGYAVKLRREGKI